MAHTALAPRPALQDQPAARIAPARMRAVLLGCGVVNGGLAGLIPPGIEIVAVLARRARPEGVCGAPVFTDADAVFAFNPDLVIEALGI